MTNQRTTWLTIREAALALGTSELTVRRRIKDGRIAHRLENGKYYVDLNVPPDQSSGQIKRSQSKRAAASTAEVGSANGSHRKPTSPSQIDLDGLLTEYSRLAESAGRAATLEQQLRELEHRYAELQDGIVSLSNRNGWLESKLDERTREIKLLSDGQHRPWWKRVFRPTEARN